MRPGESSVRKQRLLVLTSTYPRWKGDPEPAFVHQLASRLVQRFDVTVLCPHAPGARTRETLDGVDVVRYRYAPERLETLVNDGGIVANLRLHPWKCLLLPTFVLGLSWRLFRLARSRRFDVAHAHWLLPQGLLMAALHWLPGPVLPFVVTSHGADLYALQGALLRRLKRLVAKKAASVAVVSDAMKGELARQGIQGPAVTLPMGVDLSARFTPDGSERERFRILFVGRLVEKKGLRVLLAVMPEVRRRHPQARLTVVGFGPELGALQSQARMLGIEDAVEFVGAVAQSELPGFYRRATVFVAPFVRASDGDQEGLGLVTIEAIACGCPVVVSALPAVEDLLDAGRHGGILVEPGDPHALAVAVVRVLDEPAVAADRALELRRSIMQRYDWDIVAGKYGDLLESAAARQ